MKQISIINIALWAILMGIFFIPFNSWEGLPILGEFYRDSCFLFFITASFFALLKRKIKIPIKNIVFQFLILLIAWCFTATILNSMTVAEYFFKQTTGLERFINQYGALLICSIILPITFFNIFYLVNLNRLLYTIRKVILASFIIVLIYAFFEILIVKFGMQDLKIKVLNLFDYFPFTEAKTDSLLNRISSVTFEPPALGTYLLSIAGWMFSYIITSTSRWRFLPSIAVILLAFISGSRAAFFIIIVQSLAFLYILLKDLKYSKVFLNITLALTLTASCFWLVFSNQIYEYARNEIASFRLDDSDHSRSNRSRFGIQVAMYKVFLENPITGTGYGLQAFESRKKYPNWAKKNNWEFRLRYSNQQEKRFPPGYNIYLRFLSETGVVGFLIFLALLLHIFFWCYNNFRKHNTYSVIIFISMIGFSMNWLKMDSLRIYAFWICLAIIFAIDYKKLNNV
ncbi:MAG: hypothetical protein CL432_05730 [Acidimicrobiaceae bacterium]|nr:hypothetical protein [Acidimicrobiaceae bacterium]HJN53660.1 O-antigen ligase family protein [Flavobacteriaceae bacterium]